MTPCDQVTERLAVGEPLGDDLHAHVATCPACAHLLRLPGLVAATGHATEPAPGFSARVTIGAKKRIAARRRNRVALLAAAAACVLLMGGTIATREPAQPLPAAFTALSELDPIAAPSPERDDAPATSDQELAAALVRIANVDAALGPQADWSSIEAPLASYRSLLSTHRSGAPR